MLLGISLYPENVMTVLSNQKLRLNTKGGRFGFHSRNVPSAKDYYPFGMLMVERNDNVGKYRFGFNGMEKDDEVKGIGISYTTHHRLNDTRLGRWLSLDPKAHVTPNESPYSSMGNNPVVNVDPEGDCIPCLIFAGALLSNLLDAKFAEAPGTDNSLEAQKREEKTRTELGNVNSGVQIVVNPSNITRTGAKTTIGKVAANNVKQNAKQNQSKPEVPTVETSRQARREVMRKDGIPTSQQPKTQRKNESGHEYDYDVPKPGGGSKTKSVQQKTMDENHPDHWEAGTVKKDPQTGEIRYNKHGSPKLEEGKSKVNYKKE